ncbi:hypothetical protein M378DRAFT_121757 [Amanita muscaria Koide BX008]|uniref:DUF6533 domain-containing protein n=1 Tax=Amanita muscaria (strain Koide BX008) TaxID=946122 RepID=A0A0C2SW85_AMAMK|nr:hypothetical protein M378DRAFT_121757 [Amanita muscaria Koide BX008]
MLWDHIDTFVSEVELIWKRDKTLGAWLFLLNRYLIPLGFIVNLFAYLYNWDPQRCQRFVYYEGAMTIIGVSIAEIMMFLRIRCLYYTRKGIHYGLGILFLIQNVVNVWLLTKGEPVPHASDRVKACSMIFPDGLSKAATASAWLPLLYDTVVFLLTLNRVLPSKERITVSVLKRRLYEDGIIYYSAIFVVTLVLAIMIATAPDGVKNISAQYVFCISYQRVTMMSRITLNLKKAGAKGLGVRHIDIRALTPLKFSSTEMSSLGQIHDHVEERFKDDTGISTSRV